MTPLAVVEDLEVFEDRVGQFEVGRRPCAKQAESVELREAKKRIRLLEQENEVLRRAAVYLGRGVNPK